MRPRNVLLIIVMAMASNTSPAQGYDPLPFDPACGYTMFSVPKARKAPVPDGVIGDGEWDGAFVINAMGDQKARPSWTSLYARWAKWRLMWDEDNVYLCVESQRLPNENLTVAVRLFQD